VPVWRLALKVSYRESVGSAVEIVTVSSGKQTLALPSLRLMPGMGVAHSQSAAMTSIFFIAKMKHDNSLAE
jgi:hypothetical protein